MIESRWPLWLERIRDWSDPISLEEVDTIGCPAYPAGALISVRFRCTRCETWLVAFGVNIPNYADGGFVFGHTVDVECDCGAKYEVEANNSSSGWDVEIERYDSCSIKRKNPSFFQFHLERDNGYCPEVLEHFERTRRPLEDRKKWTIFSMFLGSAR